MTKLVRKEKAEDGTVNTDPILIGEKIITENTHIISNPYDYVIQNGVKFHYGNGAKKHVKG